MSAKRRASSGPHHHHQHHQQQQSPDQQHPSDHRARSQSLAAGSSTFLEGWRSRMPFLKRRQTIDNSRQCQPLMEEREPPLAPAKSEMVSADRPTSMMTTIAEDVAEVVGTSQEPVARESPDSPNATPNPSSNGMGTVIVRMEGAGQQHMADEAL